LSSLRCTYPSRKRRRSRRCTRQKGAALNSWQPTQENINALPEPLRRYVYQLETLSDPAGLVCENAILKQQLDALTKKLEGGRE